MEVKNIMNKIETAIYVASTHGVDVVRVVWKTETSVKGRKVRPRTWLNNEITETKVLNWAQIK